MPIITRQFSLEQDTPVLIATADNMPQEVHVHNHEHAQGRDLYIGPNSDVSETNGHHVIAEADMVIQLRPNDELWGMTPDGPGCDVTVLQVQKRD